MAAKTNHQNITRWQVHLFCQLNQMVKSKCAPNLSCLHYPYWHFLAVVRCRLEVIQALQCHFVRLCQKVSMCCGSRYEKTREGQPSRIDLEHCSAKIYWKKKKRKEISLGGERGSDTHYLWARSTVAKTEKQDQETDFFIIFQSCSICVTHKMCHPALIIRLFCMKEFLRCKIKKESVIVIIHSICFL